MATYHVSQHTRALSKQEAIAFQQIDILRVKTSADLILIISQHKNDTRTLSASTGMAPAWPYGKDYPALGRRKDQFPEHKPCHASCPLGCSRPWPALCASTDTAGQVEELARIQKVWDPYQDPALHSTGKGNMKTEANHILVEITKKHTLGTYYSWHFPTPLQKSLALRFGRTLGWHWGSQASVLQSWS